MKILVTGAKGFIGRNLIYMLKGSGYGDVFEFDTDTRPELLNEYCKTCDFIFHLAGVNRPRNADEFKIGNFEFTEKLLDLLKKNSNGCPIMYASTVQVDLDNPYGQSKKETERLIFNYVDETGAKALVYRFPNVFGKWCRPNYNSAIATFCYNVANDLPITVNDRSVIMNLVYIDDLAFELLNSLKGKESKNEDFCFVPVWHTEKLGIIADIIKSFPQYRNELAVPNQSDMLVKKLYSTYLSYIPKDKFKYQLNMHCDNRGSFTEFIRTADRGQYSVNVLKPNVIKGNHWHSSKHEKFLVVNGKGVIRLRMLDCTEIFEVQVSGRKLEVVDIPPGYTHNIENIGNTDMIVLMWANEPFDPENPDTYYLEVQV